MNRKHIALILLLLGVSQTVSLAQSDPTTSVDKSATIYFYQGKAMGLFSMKYKVYANGKLLCKLGRNSHCQVSLPAGPITFATKSPLISLGKQPSLTLHLEAGKTYYLQGDAKLELLPPNGPLVLTEVVPNPVKIQQINSSKAEQALITSR